MAGSILTPQSITQHAMKILDDEFDKHYTAERVFSLVEVHCNDGTVLGPIMLEMAPQVVHEIGRELIERPVITLANDTEAILVMAHQVKHLKVLRVTSKE